MTDSYSCDVCVCGGGVAGIAASLAAARSGKKVILLEKQYLLGGLATCGLITIYLPLCDGTGRQVSFGLAEELLRLSIKEECPKTRGYFNWIASDDKAQRNENTHRFEVDFNPALFAISAEKLLISEGVKILYGAYAVGANRDGNKIKFLTIEGKSGRQTVFAKSFVDATGDFDIGHFASCPEKTFGQNNKLAAWYYSYGENGHDLHLLGYADIPDEEKKGGKEIETQKFYTGLDTEELTDMTFDSHTQILNDFRQKKRNDEKYIPTLVATIPQIRMTRRIDAEYEMKYEDEHKYVEDSVGMVSNWHKRGPVYEVPFSSLWSKEVVNLIAAGRCTCADDKTWDIMRVIPCCAITGEAAGIAAAMTDDFSKIEIKKLQSEIKKRNGVIHEKDLQK